MDVRQAKKKQFASKNTDIDVIMQHQAAYTMDMALITSMDVYVTKIFLVN